MADWKRELAAVHPGARFDEPMRLHTTFRIGGPADAYVEAKRFDEVRSVFEIAKKGRVPVFLVGFGSNLLVRDGGIRGIVLRLRGEFDRLRFLGERRVWAGAGVRLPRFVTFCASHDLAGSEPLVGVPGTVGGALVMNAGTRLGEIGPLVREVDLLDLSSLDKVVRPAGKVRFRYRSSDLEGEVVLGATLELLAGRKADIMRRVDELQGHRARTQPIHTFNVGSVFKNPPDRFAARLIEKAGLKGATHGGSRISPTHANFIENRDGASAADVLALVEKAREAVRKVHGVELELEMKVVGEEARTSGGGGRA